MKRRVNGRTEEGDKSALDRLRRLNDDWPRCVQDDYMFENAGVIMSTATVIPHRTRRYVVVKLTVQMEI